MKLATICATVLVAGSIVFTVAGPAKRREADPTLAPAPPMGWNSWDSYGAAVREENVRANADYMAAHLLKYGWQYIVIDIQWYEPRAQGHDYRAGAALTMDNYGRLMPADNRFPSAANGAGFKPLADYIHSKGLKFGIHILRGIPRQAVEQNTLIANSSHRAAEIADKQNICRWNTDMYGVDISKPGAQDYYDSLVALYASWGVDFIKADDMFSPYHADEIAALHRAIVKSGRPIVLSLSAGPAPLDRAADLQANAQMWRISDDFWDDWKLLRHQFDLVRDWAPQIGKNHTWPDADMLPLGKLRITDKNGTGQTHFTPDEQRTVMNLWCIARSPLMFGGDLPSLDPATWRLISNLEVIEIDQVTTGNQQLLERAPIRVWVAQRTDTKWRYVAVFNLDDKTRDIAFTRKQLGLGLQPLMAVDVWQRKTDIEAKILTDTDLKVSLRAHASALYRLQSSLVRVD